MDPPSGPSRRRALLPSTFNCPDRIGPIKWPGLIHTDPPSGPSRRLRRPPCLAPVDLQLPTWDRTHPVARLEGEAKEARQEGSSWTPLLDPPVAVPCSRRPLNCPHGLGPAKPEGSSPKNQEPKAPEGPPLLTLILTLPSTVVVVDLGGRNGSIPKANFGAGSNELFDRSKLPFVLYSGEFFGLFWVACGWRGERRERGERGEREERASLAPVDP